jgi:hypothetical protein
MICRKGTDKYIGNAIPSLWSSMIEIGAGIICACLPSFGFLFVGTVKRKMSHAFSGRNPPSWIHRSSAGLRTNPEKGRSPSNEMSTPETRRPISASRSTDWENGATLQGEDLESYIREKQDLDPERESISKSAPSSPPPSASLSVEPPVRPPQRRSFSNFDYNDIDYLKQRVEYM